MRQPPLNHHTWLFMVTTLAAVALGFSDFRRITNSHSTACRLLVPLDLNDLEPTITFNPDLTATIKSPKVTETLIPWGSRAPPLHAYGKLTSELAGALSR